MTAATNKSKSAWLPYPWGPLPLLPARFVARPNRFIGVFCWDDDPTTTFTAHIADPGRLQELLLPNARVWVVDHGLDTHRKMRYSMPLVQSQMQSAEGHVVSIFSRLPNHVFTTAIRAKLIPEFLGYELIKIEPSWEDPISGEKSRFDALLQSPNHQSPVWVEVKGASLVEDGVCQFPDAVTSRGARQIRQLGEMASQGMETWVVFIVQRPDAVEFRPHWQRDPVFAQALHDAAKAGVKILAQPLTLDINQGFRLEASIPIRLEP
ncbi:MAG: DNA/RNA nuclease SfsA [Vampirovibrionales bacterium]|nr:DNA/RNA nuclease SfsA [Vampirovibrionales bacterium]